MRKLHKEMMLDIVKSLSEANSEIQKIFFKKDMQTLNSLLSDCAETSTQLCDFIIQLNGENIKAAEYLKEYSEIFYSISNNLDNAYELIKKLKKQIVEIENSIKNDIKIDKIEIVFMPYKASMWDSFESVWLAAKDDPQCDVHVVPIPYFDKKSDGTFGQKHYEGGEFPDYVPIVHYDDYDLVARMPDAIYILNPYDEGNYVTSVDPRFYSHELKKYTEMLVYVPYFVTGDTIAEVFCNVSAIKHADKIIVQSEAIKKTYAKYAGNKKVMALGTPKFDKVISTKREDYVIPDEWKKLIGDRKVILYNTSVTALLQGGEQYLVKLRSVLDTFKSNKNIALWWRPHPLSETTYKSMRPQLLKEYLDIVENYKREGFGIYDDTADLHRAIAVSDAYYGDWSSLVTLYCVTGKPLMIQNKSVGTEKAENCLPTETFYDDGSVFWFMASNYRRLFTIDKKTFKIEDAGQFENEETGKHLFAHIEFVGERLYFAPYEANEIGVYNVKTNKFEKAPSDKVFLPQIFTARNFDAAACRRDSQEIIKKIDPNKIFERVSACYGRIYREYSFANITHYLQFVTEVSNIEYNASMHNMQENAIKNIFENRDGSCGKKTHEYIKSEVMK